MLAICPWQHTKNRNHIAGWNNFGKVLMRGMLNVRHVASLHSIRTCCDMSRVKYLIHVDAKYAMMLYARDAPKDVKYVMMMMYVGYAPPMHHLSAIFAMLLNVTIVLAMFIVMHVSMTFDFISLGTNGSTHSRSDHAH
jgi:hypothetical protein